MTSFRNQSWSQRFTKLGDLAEGIFEKVYDEGWERFGLSRPRLRMDMLPERIRYTPDYLTSKGLVEVQGFGRDQTFKLKDDKFDALLWWHRTFRVDMFVFDSHRKQYNWIRIQDLKKAQDRADLRVFPEGKSYRAWNRNDLPISDEWTGVPEDANGRP